MPKPLLILFAFATAGLGWLATDEAAVRDLVQESRIATKQVVRRLNAWETLRRVRAGEPKGEVFALHVMSTYHLNPERLYPEAVRVGLEREFGPPNPETGLEYLRRAGEAGHPWAKWRYWDRTGWPSTDSLFMLAEAGDIAASQNLLDRVAKSGCDWDEEFVTRLERAFEARPSKKLNTYQRAVKQPYNLATIRDWHRESCTG